MAGDELVVGRSSSSGLVLPDPYLSRRQARLYRGEDGWYLEDLGGRNAGHNPALLLRAGGGSEPLAATGLPLGLLPIADCSSGELAPASGDALIVYTDGITEAANPEGEEYGLERLEQTVRRYLGGPLDGVLEGLELDLEGFVRGVPYGDDRTILVLRRVS